MLRALPLPLLLAQSASLPIGQQWTNHEQESSSKVDHTIFTDIDLEPIITDTNPAHFDGFLYEIADFCQRTGKFLPLLTQGVATRGHRTVVDSPAAVPFVQQRFRHSGTILQRLRSLPSYLQKTERSQQLDGGSPLSNSYGC